MIGLACGLQINPLGLATDPLLGITRDATSGIYAPATAGEWATVLAAAGISSGGPASLFLCQEVSGDLADSIGALTLTASGSPLYAQTVSGWSRKGVGFNQASGQKFSAALGVGPSPAAESVAWLVYATVAAPSAQRIVFGTAGTVVCEARINTTPKMQLVVSSATAVGTSNPTSAGVQPMLLVYNRTAGTVVLYTEQDQISGTYTATVTDGVKGIGGLSGSSFLGTVVYAAVFSGASAEFSVSQVRQLYVLLGFSPAW